MVPTQGYVSAINQTQYRIYWYALEWRPRAFVCQLELNSGLKATSTTSFGPKSGRTHWMLIISDPRCFAMIAWNYWPFPTVQLLASYLLRCYAYCYKWTTNHSSDTFISWPIGSIWIRNWRFDICDSLKILTIPHCAAAPCHAYCYT